MCFFVEYFFVVVGKRLLPGSVAVLTFEFFNRSNLYVVAFRTVLLSFCSDFVCSVPW